MLKITTQLFLYFLSQLHSTIAQDYDYITIKKDNIRIPITNNGSLGANSKSGFYEPIEYDEIISIFSSGIVLSGYGNDSLWSEGIFYPSHIEDFVPGRKLPSGEIEHCKIFFLRASDPDFGASWLEWKYATKLGAKFYDGDNDSLYNPVDKNGNGVWDKDEDRPDLIGDYTAWFVCTDNVPAKERRFTDVTPKGINIEQSIFGFDAGTSSYLKNVFFIRYTVENSGAVSELYDSVYIGIIFDPDIGVSDDLVGCDTTRNGGFAYNEDKDEKFGELSPSVFIRLLQGPTSFIPGTTFLDNNNDGNYNWGIDTPLDTAKVNNGKYRGAFIYPGAKNLSVSAFTFFIQAVPGIGDPYRKEELRYYLEGGKFSTGEDISVRDFIYGNGKELGAEADLILPNFMFSGDPLTNEGWLPDRAVDFRCLMSIGPLSLHANIPLEFIAAFIFGERDLPLRSLLNARNKSEDIAKFYENNFIYFPTNIGQNSFIQHKNNLEVNIYPNPFNSQTTIRFWTSTNGNITIKLYNTLGEEIQVISDKYYSKGEHVLGLNGYMLSTGIYFLCISDKNFFLWRKIMLIK